MSHSIKIRELTFADILLLVRPLQEFWKCMNQNYEIRILSCFCNQNSIKKDYLFRTNANISWLNGQVLSKLHIEKINWHSIHSNYIMYIAPRSEKIFRRTTWELQFLMSQKIKKIALVLDYVILFFVRIMNTHLIPTNSWDILRQILSFYLPLTFF